MSDKYLTAGQKASYGVGRQMGDQIAAQPFDGVDAQAVADGVFDAISGNASVINEEDLRAAFGVIEQQMKEKAEAQAEVAAQAGLDFLAENAKKDSVTQLDSGLQYEVLSTGEGEKPLATSTVKTHYHGTLITGEVFDSSVERGEPAQFAVNGVIPGWTEALQLMTPGSKWRLFIPSDLAYGAGGAGGQIGPHTTLVFEVELLEVVS